MEIRVAVSFLMNSNAHVLDFKAQPFHLKALRRDGYGLWLTLNPKIVE
jgi:hypothetical protein